MNIADANLFMDHFPGAPLEIELRLEVYLIIQIDNKTEKSCW